MGDNDFEFIPPEIGQLKNLQIVSSTILLLYHIFSCHIPTKLKFILQLVLRDNDLIELPKEIGDLARLRELHIQGNRLTVLPPEIGL